MNTDSPVQVTEAARSSTISTGDGDGAVDCLIVALGCLDMVEEDAVRIPEAAVTGVESRSSIIAGVPCRCCGWGGGDDVNGSVIRLVKPGDWPLARMGVWQEA